MRQLPGLIVALGAVLALSSGALAQDGADSAALARARASFDAAQFARAVSALTALLEEGALSREELEQALSLLALSSRGAGDEAALERALVLISLLDDGERVLARAPPSLRARFGTVREGRPEPRLTVDVAEQDGSLVLRAEVEPAVPLTRARVHARRESGPWEHAAGRLTLTLDAPIEYYATLELAGVALRESPRATRAPGERAPDAALVSGEPAAAGGGDDAVWWTLGVLSVAALIGAAIVIGWVVSQPSSTTVVIGPT